MNVLIKRSELRPHERFLIWRLRSGMTQELFAKYLGIPYGRCRAIEKGRSSDDLKKIDVQLKGPLSPMEMCIIARRRRKKKQAHIAKALGVCRYQIVKMEAGEIDCSPLYTYWLHERNRA